MLWLALFGGCFCFVFFQDVLNGFFKYGGTRPIQINGHMPQGFHKRFIGPDGESFSIHASKLQYEAMTTTFNKSLKIPQVVTLGRCASPGEVFRLLFIEQGEREVERLSGVFSGGIPDSKNLAGCGKTPLHRHSRESGSPEGIEKTGFLLPQE